MKKLLYVLASLIFVSAIGAFAAACKPDEPETPPENEITISISGAAERTLVEGHTLQLTAETNSKETVTWSSSSEENATVSALGLVTAVKEGKAVITASVEGKSAACSIIVERDTTLIGSYWIGFEGGKTEEVVEKGETLPLRAALYLGGSGAVEGAALRYESDNENVATVDENGTVTAVASGTAHITVSYTPAEGDGVPAPDDAVFTVVVPRDLRYEISSEKEDLALEADRNDREVQLTAAVYEDETEISDEEYEKLVWTSSDPEIASVDENGNVTARSEGEVTITASYDIGSVSCAVTVWTDYIGSGEEFYAIYERENWAQGWYLLTDDIEIPPVGSDPAHSEGILNYTYVKGSPQFSGMLDGGGHTLGNIYGRLFMGVNGGTIRNVTLKGESGYWGGLFGDYFESGLVENVTAEITFTKTEATNNTTEWWKRSTGGFFNFAQGGTFRNVTVYAVIPDDIDTDASTEATAMISEMSAFGRSNAAGSIFENCRVYADNTAIQFAALAQPTQFIDCSGTVEVWTGPYTVEHYKPNAEGGYDLFLTENLKAPVGSTATAAAQPPEGYVLSEGYVGNVESAVIPYDGSAVTLKLYYVEEGLIIETEKDSYVFNLDANEVTAAASVVVEKFGAAVEDAEVIWSSSDPDVVAVDENGNLTAKKEGEVTIYATYNGVSCNITAAVYTRFIGSDADFAKIYATDAEGVPEYADGWYYVTADFATVNRNVQLINTPFSGRLDGNGYTISGVANRIFTSVNGGVIRNINFSGYTDSWGGLFGEEIAGESVVENVTVTMDVRASWALEYDKTYAHRSLGILANYIKGGTLTNVTVYADIADDIGTQAYQDNGNGPIYPVSGISGLGDMTNSAATVSGCKVYSNDLSIQFAKGYAGAVEGWYADYKVEHYVYDLEENAFVLHTVTNEKGLRDKTVEAQPVDIEGYFFYADNRGNVTEGVAHADGSLVLKLYYALENVSMEATTEQNVNLSLTSGQQNTAKSEINVLLGETPVTEGVAWSSADEDVAVVDQNGNITAVAHGKTEIVAMYGGVEVHFNVTVYDMFLASAADFMAMYAQENYETKWYLMTEDIALDSATEDWTNYVIKSDSKVFSGVFDGGGHTLDGIHVRMFAQVNGGTIRNLNAIGNAGYWGGIFGNTMRGDSLVENVTATITLSNTTGHGEESMSIAARNGGLFCYVSGRFKNVTVYMNAADAETGQFPLSEVSAFGYCDDALAVFENCRAYSDDTSIRFALAVQAQQLVGSVGAVHKSLTQADAGSVQNLSLTDDDSIRIVITNAGAEEIVWTSSDASVATAENGVVKALKHGDVTITAAYGDKKVDFNVRVYDKFLASDADFGVMYNDAQYHTKWYLMTADVTLTTDYESKVIYSTAAFSGLFDGGNHTIAGLTHRLLPNMVEGGAVRNLKVEGAVMDVWAGVFGELMQNGTLENVEVTVKMTNTVANGDGINWFQRSAGGLYNFIAGGTLKNVTVYVEIPSDITVTGAFTVAQMSAFGAITAPAAATFDNCQAYSNSTEIQFAAGVAADKLVNGTSGEVQSWTIGE